MVVTNVLFVLIEKLHGVAIRRRSCEQFDHVSSGLQHRGGQLHGFVDGDGGFFVPLIRHSKARACDTNDCR